MEGGEEGSGSGDSLRTVIVGYTSKRIPLAWYDIGGVELASVGMAWGCEQETKW